MGSIKKKCKSLLCVLLGLLLCACGEKPGDSEVLPPEESGPYTLTVPMDEPQTTLSPAAVTENGGEMILYHLFENLLRWEDGGDGWAVLANGQAESYTVETDYAGNATYTFTLREDAKWSDGRAVTAEDFVTAWQRLADPANELPHRELMSAVAGFGEVLEDGTPAPLGVSAPDSRTFVAVLKGSPAWFLEEVCAGAYTMPIRSDLVNQSTGAITNGAYTATTFHRGQVVLERSETYYNNDPLGPEVIQFQTAAADYEDPPAGEPVLTTSLSDQRLQELSDSGLWTPEPVTGTYGVLLNTLTVPFDDVNVRMAFHLAVDRQALTDAVGNLTLRPAPGVVPYGVSDYSARPVVEEDVEEDALPDPNAEPEPEKPAPTCWDFRAHSLELVTAEHTHDYETDRSYAQALMANAGYPGGSGFPAVEYIYVEQTVWDGTLASALCEMWKETLGVSISAREVSRSEYDALLAPAVPEEGEEDTEVAESSETEPVPAFQMAGQVLSPAYSDAGALLNCWHSGNEANVTGYASDAFDILLDAARSAVSPDARDAYLHDAEAILLKDSPVIPILCQGGSFQLSEGLDGLYRAPDGVFFLYGVHRGNSDG